MQITINNQTYTYKPTAGEQAGLGFARARVMEVLPPGEGQAADTPLSERPGYVSDDAAYLQGIVQRHYEATQEDPQAVMQRALRSWSTDEPTDPPAEPLSEEAHKAVLAAYAAQKRWQVETGGCDWGPHRVQTDRDSQSKMIAEFVAIQAGMRKDPSPWKFADGFALVSNKDMGAIILAVRAHIVQAFEREAAIVVAIKTGKIADITAVDAAFA